MQRYLSPRGRAAAHGGAGWGRLSDLALDLRPEGVRRCRCLTRLAATRRPSASGGMGTPLPSSASPASPSASARSSPTTPSTFELRRGEVVALLGENGAGKTTLMNILFGHYVADEGTVEAFGQPLPPGDPRAALAAGIGMVHQHFTLADNLTVLDNIMLGTEPLWRLAPRPARRARKRIAQLAARVRPRRRSGRAVSRAVGRRAPARRDPEGALPRRAHPDPRRADGGADAARDRRRCSRTLQAAGRERACRSSSSRTSSNEVMAVSDRIAGAARRASWPASARPRDDQPAGTRRADGRPRGRRARRRSRRRPAGRCSSWTTCRRAAAARRALDGVDAHPARRRDHRHRRRLRQRPGGARRRCSPGTRRRRGGDDRARRRRRSATGRRARLSTRGIARIPEDRHAVGTIGDMSVAENVIARALSPAALQPLRLPRLGARRGPSPQRDHRRLRRAVPVARRAASGCSPAATCRS